MGRLNSRARLAGLAVSVLLAGLVMTAGFTSSRPTPQSFKLLAFQLASEKQPVHYSGVLLPRSISRQDSVAFAWVDIGTKRVKPLSQRPKGGEVLFHLVSKSGKSWPVEAYVVPSIKQTNVACLNFIPGSGGEFVEPKLVASVDGKQMGAWTLSDYPTDELLIPQSEALVTQAELVGLSVSAKMDATPYDKPASRETGFVNLMLNVTGRFEPGLEYWVYYEVPETTWRKEHYFNRSGSVFTEPRETGSGMATEFAGFADRARVTGTVEARQAYEEPAVFRNLQIVRDNSNGDLFVVNQREQRVELSTGVPVVMPRFAIPIVPDQSTGKWRIGFEVLFPQGSTDLQLPQAGGKLRKTTGVSLRNGHVVANEIWTGAGGGINSGKWQLQMLVSPKTVKSGMSFDVSIGCKHEVVLAKEDYRLLIPIESKSK